MKNKLKTIVRLLNPLFNILNIITVFKNFKKYPIFLIGFFKYRSLSNEVVNFSDIWPTLNDTTSASQTGGGQFFYLDNWALNKVYKSKVKEHYDVASRIDGFTSQCSVFTNVKFIDYRYVDYGIENMICMQGDILDLPFENDSIHSLSALHVVAHIGLGRYGDPINVNGSILALKELQRILAKNGNLYIGIPIGKERVMYHAHRIFNAQSIVGELSGLSLQEFSAVNDEGVFLKNANLDDFNESFYSLGLFHFTKE
jgi:hypothetical protein